MKTGPTAALEKALPTCCKTALSGFCAAADGLIAELRNQSDAGGVDYAIVEAAKTLHAKGNLPAAVSKWLDALRGLKA